MPRPLLRRLTLAALATLVSLGAAELALRILDLPAPTREFHFVGPDREVADLFNGLPGLVPDPELFWRIDPARESGRLLNALGLRGWLPPRAKKARDLRVVCLGDSCTFGLGVSYEDTYGARLDAALQDAWPDRCVEVVLAGLPGYSSRQTRVLFARHGATWAPDLVTIYCGAWNDYLPAVGQSDAERARRAHGLRLVAVLETARSASELDAYRQAFRGGAAPDGLRVPLAEFRANLLEVIAHARALRSAVVLIVPPVPANTAGAYPAGAAYRDCVRSLAQIEGLPVVDADALFAARAGESLFVDWVHPNRRGHHLLAERLFECVRGLVPVRPTSPRSAAPSLASVSPSSVSALAPTSIVVTGVGLGAPQAFDRLFLGDRWLPDVTPLDADRVQVQLTRSLAPGVHVISLRTAQGLVRSDVRLEVTPPRPPQLRIELLAGAAAPTLRVTGATPAEMAVVVWFAAARGVPVPTTFGDFHLQVPSDVPVRAPLVLDSLAALDSLPLPRAIVGSHAGGFQLDWPVPAELATNPVLYVQAGIRDAFEPTLGVLTEVATIELRR